MRERLEAVLEWGGVKKDVVCIIASAVALVASFMSAGSLPVDPAWLAILLCGVPTVCEATLAVVYEHDIKADLLVSLALIASIVVGEYFAAGEVALIMQLGGLLEQLTVARARAGIERLVEMTPTQARVVRGDGVEQTCEVESVAEGDLVRVLPGETIPVDGRVVAGTTSVNEAVLTGEPMPCDKQVGDEVFSGTINQFGAIEVRATRPGSDGSMQRMARLVSSAEAGKAKIVRLADRWATWIVVGALVAAGAIFALTGEALRAVTVLVVFCPCALVLATPTAVMAAIGNASKHGFLVKEGDALERLASVKKVAFDKTGTLTEGRPRLVSVKGAPGCDLAPGELLGMLASCELLSEHPLGKAVVEAAREKGCALDQPERFEMVPGRGVRARVAGRDLVAGNLAMMAEMGLAEDAWANLGLKEARDLGHTVILVSADGEPFALAALSDTIRAGVRQTVVALSDEGVKGVLLTGDHAAAAHTIAQAAGINEVVAECMPQDKLTYVETSEARGTSLAMVGDGVNDAPALKRAFVGIAMGGVGSDIAVDAADIAVVGDSISELPHLFSLSHAMMRRIKVNLTFSMVLNFVAIVLAMLAVLDPVSGALVHNCGSVFVIVNSAFLLKWRQKGR